MPLDPQHVALADIIRRRSRKAHYMAATSPGRMGIIRGIASIAADYAEQLPNGQRSEFLAQCGHAAATVRGEYDRAPSFIHHKARETDPGTLERCNMPGCENDRRANRVICNDHLAEHIATMAYEAGLDRRAPPHLVALVADRKQEGTTAFDGQREDWTID